MTTETTWKGELLFETTQENHGKVIMDGNRTAGISPKALLLAGLSGCSAVDVVEILQKMRVPFESLTVTAAADQTEEHPRVFTDISLVYRLKASAEDREKIVKAIELSMEKYCGVAAMLRKNSAIQYKLVLL
jgi:putative redox protein